MPQDQLILASSSPRRLELLKQINIVPDYIIPPDIDETRFKNESPISYVQRISEEKANKIFKNESGKFVLAADTIVSTSNRILPKANNDSDVEKFLSILSGRQHTVISSLCLIAPDGRKSKKKVSTKVKLKRLTHQEIKYYLDSKEGIGKAGGYAIQGIAAQFILRTNGSYSSVVGLPLYETVASLKGLSFQTK